MKQLIISFWVAFFMINLISAQTPEFAAAMEQGLKQMKEAGTPETLQAAANHFERIATAEKKDWLSPYYQAYCQAMLATMAMQKGELSRCDALLDKAQEALDRSREAAGEQSDIAALQGLIYTGRIWSDPQSKGPKFSPLAHESFGKAQALDGNNPRAFMLQGQLVLFTPAFWGGGAEGALPLLEKAREKFEVQAPVSALHPQWGKEQNEWLLAKARGN